MAILNSSIPSGEPNLDVRTSSTPGSAVMASELYMSPNKVPNQRSPLPLPSVCGTSMSGKPALPLGGYRDANRSSTYYLCNPGADSRVTFEGTNSHLPLTTVNGRSANNGLGWRSFSTPYTRLSGAGSQVVGGNSTIRPSRRGGILTPGVINSSSLSGGSGHTVAILRPNSSSIPAYGSGSKHPGRLRFQMQPRPTLPSLMTPCIFLSRICEI
ncbi:unnamed protein product [Protopolystoma xenopodis]|uniref:Uncharacterized protein n=1 Tax=Protopolystoma xenopodis TaxID=117903 RepID=A0A3S5AVW3_9PLAT|nr:unnamed protein product [Protopolystoma xenopodis]